MPRQSHRFLVAVACAVASLALSGGSATAGDPPPATSGSLSVTSDPGDSVGLGQSSSAATPNDSFLGASDWTNSVVHLNVHTADGHSWFLTFGAPFDQQLLPGTYDGATRFRGFGTAGLDVSHDSFGCNQTTGSFTVLDASYAGYGYLLRFHATFEQHCEGSAPALRGEIEIVNPTPPPAPTASLQLTIDPQGQLTGHGAAIVHGTVSCSTVTTFAPTIFLDMSEQTKDGGVSAQTFTYGGHLLLSDAAALAGDDLPADKHPVRQGNGHPHRLDWHGRSLVPPAHRHRLGDERRAAQRGLSRVTPGGPSARGNSRNRRCSAGRRTSAPWGSARAQTAAAGTVAVRPRRYSPSASPRSSVDRAAVLEIGWCWGLTFGSRRRVSACFWALLVRWLGAQF